jgi:quinohemoprotein ethanol dehydrogenase
MAMLELTANGDNLTGKVTADQGAVNIAGKVENGRARLSGKASMPMPITVSYDLAVRDGKLAGDNANGPFGTFPITGTRAP